MKDFGQSGRLYSPMSEVTDGAIILSGVHCDVEMTISEHGNVQLDFGNDEVETDYTAFLDIPLIEPDTDTNVDQLGGNARYLRRNATDRQTGGQSASCSGTVHLLWLKEYLPLILTPSLRKEGAYERLGFLYLRSNDPKMPKTVQRSNITLV